MPIDTDPNVIEEIKEPVEVSQESNANYFYYGLNTEPIMVYPGQGKFYWSGQSQTINTRVNPTLTKNGAQAYETYSSGGYTYWKVNSNLAVGDSFFLTYVKMVNLGGSGVQNYAYYYTTVNCVVCERPNTQLYLYTGSKTNEDGTLTYFFSNNQTDNATTKISTNSKYTIPTGTQTSYNVVFEGDEGFY